MPQVHFSGQMFSTWLIFGTANVILMMLLFIYLAHRRGLDMATVLGLVLCYTLGAALGTVAVPSVMGAIALAIIFLLVGKRILGIEQPLGDLLAINIALIVGIGRIGCLLHGCCFGRPTSLPWGIEYPVGTLPHWLHSATGLITPQATASLALHPIQLYEAIFLFGAAGVMLLFGRRMNNRNAMLPLFFSFYLFLRFLIEFIRDITNVPLSVIYLGPLSIFQWLLLLLAVLFLGLAYVLETQVPERSHGRMTVSAIGGNQVGPALIVGAALITLVFYHERLFAIHLLELSIMIPLCAAAYAYRYMVANTGRVYSSLGFATSLAIMLLLPFISTIRAQFESTAGDTLAGLREKTSVYAVHPQTKKLVRLGNENITFEQFRRINRRLNFVPAGEEAALFQELEAGVESPALQYYYGLGLGKYQIETCAGRRNFVYGGAVIGREKVHTATNYTRYQGTRLALNITSGDVHETDPSLVLYNQWDYRKFGVGLSGVLMPFGAYDDPNLLFFPGFHLRGGSERLNISIGVIDRVMVRPEPVYAHLSVAGLTKKGSPYRFGLTNLGPPPFGLAELNGIPAAFISFRMKRPGGLNIFPTFIFRPHSGRETGGFGLNISFMDIRSLRNYFGRSN
ncbi:MAG: prolipoprotein diacylglyceryl transferase family protein [Candidatus Neomarinimicrobiota bacterium]